MQTLAFLQHYKCVPSGNEKFDTHLRSSSSLEHLGQTQEIRHISGQVVKSSAKTASAHFWWTLYYPTRPGKWGFMNAKKNRNATNAGRSCDRNNMADVVGTNFISLPIFILFFFIFNTRDFKLKSNVVPT